MADSKAGGDENLSVEDIEALINRLAVKPPPAVVQPALELFQVEGDVIGINKSLLFFDIETQRHRARIYVAFYKTLVFPKIGQFVKITQIKHFKHFCDPIKDNKGKTVHRTTTCVVDQESIIKIKTTSKNKVDQIGKCYSPFLLFLIAHKIEMEELITINENIVKVVECFIYSEEDLLLLIRAIYTVCVAPSRNKDFRLQIRLPIDLKYVNTQYDEVYASFDFHPPCAVNVYPSRTNAKIMTSPTCCETVTDVLIGTLVVQSSTAQFILKAYSANIVVKFLDSPDSLEKINNALVLIKKYTVFTEIYTVKDYPPLLYVLIDPQDVVVVKHYFDPSFKMENRILFEAREALPRPFKYKHELEIAKKSDVIMGYRGNKEIWMEARVKTDCSPLDRNQLPYPLCQTTSYRAFVILPCDFIRLAPILRQRRVYFFFTNTPLKLVDIYQIRELKALQSTSTVYYVPPDALFQETEEEPLFENIHENATVPELKATMKKYLSKTFSFEINISKKIYIISNFKSWYAQRHEAKFFGEVDKYQQKLIFYDEKEKQYADLYLSNRENIAFPLGLVADMKIRVNHIAVNKGKYLRTTPLTTFDILEYRPRNKLSSANLAVTRDGKWNFRTTPPSLFSSYFLLPSNTIIHGPITLRAIYDLNMNIICGNCKHVNFQVDGCTRCKSLELDVLVSIIFNASDGTTRQHFKVFTDSIDFLFDILTVSETVRPEFLRAIQRYGPINFNLLKVPLDFKEPKSIVVESMITKLREQVNFVRPITLDVVAITREPSPGCRLNPWVLMDYTFFIPTNEAIL